MRISKALPIDDVELAAFCRRHGIVRLSLFGSALTGQLRAGSDIDLLVEFASESVPGLLGVSALERELSELIGGRDVDLRTPGDLSPRFRDQVQDEARELYATRGRSLSGRRGSADASWHDGARAWCRRR